MGGTVEPMRTLSDTRRFRRLTLASTDRRAADAARRALLTPGLREVPQARLPVRSPPTRGELRVACGDPRRARAVPRGDSGARPPVPRSTRRLPRTSEVCSAILGLFGATSIVAVDGIAFSQLGQPEANAAEMGALLDRIMEVRRAHGSPSSARCRSWSACRGRLGLKRTAVRYWVPPAWRQPRSDLLRSGSRRTVSSSRSRSRCIWCHSGRSAGPR